MGRRGEMRGKEFAFSREQEIAVYNFASAIVTVMVAQEEAEALGFVPPLEHVNATLRDCLAKSNVKMTDDGAERAYLEFAVHIYLLRKAHNEGSEGWQYNEEEYSKTLGWLIGLGAMHAFNADEPPTIVVVPNPSAEMTVPDEWINQFGSGK